MERNMIHRLWALSLLLWLFSLSGCQLQQEKLLADPVPPDWLSYTNGDVGYSIRYPPDVATFRTLPGQYHRISDEVIIAPGGDHHVKVFVLRNLDELPLDEFVLTAQAIPFDNVYSDDWPTTSYQEFITPVKVAGGYPALRVQRSEGDRTAGTYPLTVYCKYLTYVSHNDAVILFLICPNNRSPRNLEPDEALVEIYNRITNSIEF
jgi:hypothetical protein